MAVIVTLDQLKEHMKLGTGTAQDDDLELKLDVAEEMVLDYMSQRLGSPGIQSDWSDTVSAWDDSTAPRRVVHAILAMAAWLVKHTGDEHPDDTPQLDPGDLPREVKFLIYRLRDPAIA